MGKTEIMSEILDKISQRGLFQSIKRYPYLPYNINMALQVVDAIGKNRNPKFRIDDENRFTYENMIRWVHGDPEMKCLNPDTKEIIPGRLNAGIYIAGNTGSGKSWVLEIMAAYSLIDNVQVTVGDTQRCLYWGNVRTDAICDEYTADGSFERFKKMSIVGIQDLGAEPTESLYMGNRINVLRQILEYRGDRTDQLTLITSNLPMNHKRFVERYDDRVASRLNEMCNYFEITGVDRRKIK
jgi:DNA replication protein DnaC